MSNITRKIVAIVTALTVSLMIAGPAMGETAADLQAQITALLAQLNTLQSQLSTLEGAAAPAAGVPAACSGITFSRNLSQGMSGNDVKCLQALLNQDAATQVAASGVGSAGNETTYFGALTKAAVVKYQEKNAADILTPLGLTAGTGFVGAKTVAKLNAVLTGTAPAEEVPAEETAPAVEIPASGVAVSLASTTPAATTIAGGATNVVFTRINFTAAEDTIISSIAIKRSGLASNADITAVRLWEGSVQVGGTQALNSVTYKATFVNLNWSVPAGTSKTLTVTANMQVIASGATAGNAPILGIAAATDVVADKTVSGTFPVNGNPMTLAGISVGYLDVDANGYPANSYPLSGSTDQEVASWTFTASSTEGFTINAIKFTQIGSAGNADISNIKVKILGQQVGPTVASLAADSTATFDFSASPITINAGAAKVIYLYCDVAAGIVTSRTIRFEIGETAHVTAFGTNSGGAVTITKTAGTHSTYTTQQSVAQTISQSSGMTVALNGATNPSAKAFVNGTTGQLVTALRFTAGSEENLRVARLKLSLGGTGADATDLSNVTLYKYDEATATETMVDTPTNFVGTLATWGADSTGLDTGVFDVTKSGHVVIHVRADISSSASYTALGIYVNEVKVDGITSQGNLDTSLVTISSVDTLAEVTNHSANAAKGTIVMATSPSTPAATVVVPGTTDYPFLAVDFTASGEDIILSSLTVNLYQSAIGTKTAAAAGDFVNVKLWDGTTQLGTTVSSPVATATFSTSLVLTKDVVKTLKVTADVPADTVSASRWSSNVGSMGMDADIYATGVSSGQVIADPSTDADGTNQTALAESLTVSFLAPSSTNQMINASNAELAKMVLTAGAAGDIRVSSVKFTAGSDTSLTHAAATDTFVGSLKLYDGATQVGTVQAAFTDSGSVTYVQFTGLSVTVPKAQQKVLTLKGNILLGSDNVIAVGCADLTDSGGTDVVGTGLSSNSTVYGTGSNNANSGVITLRSAGTLAVAVSSDTPVAANVAIGANGVTGVPFSSIKLTATNEAINLLALKVALQTDGTNHVPDIAAIHLYQGSTEVSSAGYLTGTSASANVYHTFYIGGVTIPKDDYITLTLKVDLNGTSNGATSKHTPRFYVADVAGNADLLASDVKATGASSGATVVSSAGTPDPQTATNFNEMTLVKTKPTFALATGSPSGTLVPSSLVRVLDFTVTADAKGDVVFTTGDSITFTVSGFQGDNDTTSDTITVYRADTGASVGTATADNSLDVGDTVTVTITDTIAAGTTRTYYVKCDLDDYETDGDSFRLSIAATSGHVVWSDGTTAGANVSNALTSGLPIDGGFFVNPS